jgi:hypothetical protein
MQLLVLSFLLITVSACGASSGGSSASATQVGPTGGSSGAPVIGSAGESGTQTASAGMSASAAGSGGQVSVASRPPTFTRVWSEVLEKKGCSGQYCHGSGQGGLKFASQAEAYTALVGVAAAGPKCMSSGLMRVKASDSASSLLVEKLSKATPACGDIMPIGTKLDPDCLSMNPSVCNTQTEITLVKQWIDAGAKND